MRQGQRQKIVWLYGMTSHKNVNPREPMPALTMEGRTRIIERESQSADRSAQLSCALFILTEMLSSVRVSEQLNVEPNLPVSLRPPNYSPPSAAPPRSPQTQSRRRLLSKITTLHNRLQPHSPSDLDTSTHKHGHHQSNATQIENTEMEPKTGHQESLGFKWSFIKHDT